MPETDISRLYECLIATNSDVLSIHQKHRPHSQYRLYMLILSSELRSTIYTHALPFEHRVDNHGNSSKGLGFYSYELLKTSPEFFRPGSSQANQLQNVCCRCETRRRAWRTLSMRSISMTKFVHSDDCYHLPASQQAYPLLFGLLYKKLFRHTPCPKGLN